MIPDSHQSRKLPTPPKCAICVHSVVPRGTWSYVCGYGEDIDEDTLILLGREKWREAEALGGYFDDASFNDDWIGERRVGEDDICDEFKEDA